MKTRQDCRKIGSRFDDPDGGAFRGIASLISPVGQGLTNAALTIRLGLLESELIAPETGVINGLRRFLQRVGIG